MDEGYLLKNPCSCKKIIIPGVVEKEDIEVEVFTVVRKNKKYQDLQICKS
jgi:hypothetical protein